jgi:hypothetical protein
MNRRKCVNACLPGGSRFISSSAVACAYYSQKYFEKAQRRLVEALDAEFADDQRLVGKRETERTAVSKRGHARRKWATFLVTVSVLAFVTGVGLGMYAVI